MSATTNVWPSNGAPEIPEIPSTIHAEVQTYYGETL